MKLYIFSLAIYTSATFALHVAGQLCIITLKGRWDWEITLEIPTPPSVRQPYCFSAWTEVVWYWWDVVFIVMTAGLEKFKVFVERRVHIGPEASNLVIRGPFDLIIWSWLSKHVHALFPDTARQRGQDTIWLLVRAEQAQVIIRLPEHRKHPVYTWYQDPFWVIRSQLDNAKYRCEWRPKCLWLDRLFFTDHFWLDHQRCNLNV